MSLQIFSEFAFDPNVGPSLTAGGTGTVDLAYRWVLNNGQYTNLSPALTDLSYPFTAEIGTLPPSLFDAVIGEYEFLVSNDSGATWVPIPRTDKKNPVVSQSSAPTGSAVPVARNIQPGNPLDIGAVTAGQDIEVPVFVLNEQGTDSFRDLVFGVFDDDTPSTKLSGKLSFLLDGVGTAPSNGTVDSQSGQTIWDASSDGDNFIECTVDPDSVAILTAAVSVSGGLFATTTINVDLEVSTSVVSIPIHVGWWQQGSFLLSADFDATYPLLSEGSTISLGPSLSLDYALNGANPDTITRNDVSGDWIADGVLAGDRITISNAQNAGNNQTVTVDSLTTTVLTLAAGDSVTADTGDNTATLLVARGLVVLQRMFLNLGGGRGSVQRASRVLGPFADDTYRVYANSLGRITVQATSETLPSLATVIAEFTITDGRLTAVVPKSPPSSAGSFFSETDTAAVTLGRWLRFKAGGNKVEHAQAATDVVVGVAMFDAAASSTVTWATLGPILVQAGEALVVGDGIVPGTDGKSFLPTGSQVPQAICYEDIPLDEWGLAIVLPPKGQDGLTFVWKGPWVTATSYVIQDVVSSGGNAYICKTAHTSAAATEPNVGGSWQTVWDAYPLNLILDSVNFWEKNQRTAIETVAISAGTATIDANDGHYVKITGAGAGGTVNATFTLANPSNPPVSTQSTTISAEFTVENGGGGFANPTLGANMKIAAGAFDTTENFTNFIDMRWNGDIWHLFINVADLTI